MRTVVVIPARYGSRRLLGKPIISLKGKPLIQYVYENALGSMAQQVLVATDDERIRQVVEGFGGKAVMTSPNHPSGTDRVAEAVKGLDAEVVVNLQCDEPLLEARYIDLLITAFQKPEVEMATLVAPLDPDGWQDPATVKVVRDLKGFALYFSRASIPFPRDGSPLKEGVYWRHVGVYAYRKPFLLTLASLPPTPLEEEEKLEQLRALEHGFRIYTIVCDYSAPGVDTEKDLRRVLSLLP